MKIIKELIDKLMINKNIILSLNLVLSGLKTIVGFSIIFQGTEF